MKRVQTFRHVEPPDADPAQDPAPDPHKPASTTQVLKTLRAGSPGTVRLERLYGDKLLFVRQRLDPTRRLRYTTVELVVSTRRAMPYLRDKVLYPVRISPGDHDTRRRLIDADAEWNSKGRFWWLTGAKIRHLKLADKVLISLAKRR
jgi:hypothetical protein